MVCKIRRRHCKLCSLNGKYVKFGSFYVKFAVGMER